MKAPIHSAADVPALAARLRAGGLVAFPTETVYGLGADAGNADALANHLGLTGIPFVNVANGCATGGVVGSGVGGGAGGVVQATNTVIEAMANTRRHSEPI